MLKTKWLCCSFRAEIAACAKPWGGRKTRRKLQKIAPLVRKSRSQPWEIHDYGNDKKRHKSKLTFCPTIACCFVHDACCSAKVTLAAVAGDSWTTGGSRAAKIITYQIKLQLIQFSSNLFECIDFFKRVATMVTPCVIWKNDYKLLKFKEKIILTREQVLQTWIAKLVLSVRNKKTIPVYK